MEYKIGGKTYTQKPLVLGQMRQLMSLLQGIVLPPDKINTFGVIFLLGNKLPAAIAIVLIPEGTNLKDKDVNVLAKEIEFEISPEQTIEVINDFFTCNPLASLFKNISEMAEKITAQMQETLLNKSASSSPAEMSPNETASSGVLH
ncbi:MAG: hypothetical protein A3K22_00970 [Deltaproteobacteria bacterium RBG_16_42_7]|nr:MAG: hypothetical protein A3K22_00970 [Deltaproteobacteria bacterium RBG_16_42_7]